jgi:superfamily II DNA or RNA helicase
MNNQEKGLLYEKYVKDFIIQKIGCNAYLWNECPENILIDNALVDSHNDMRLIRKDIKEGYLHTHKDIGIDIIQLDNNRCSIVQCKNGYSNGLCVDDISGIMMRSNFMRDVPTFIYYTNCLSRNVKYTSILSPYVVNIDCSVNIDKLLEVSIDNKIYFVKLPYEDKNNQEITKTEIIPYSYQSEAVAKFKEHFESNNRGILSLPCGCGKTYTSYIISSDYSHIIILSPLREFASQNLNRFIEYGYDKNNTLLVDSDGNRDIDSIKEIIKNKNKLLISCTYNSMDLITECLDLFKDALFIVDEFHNLSKANISDDENHIFKLLMSDYKILFMSATPRIYDIEYDDEAFDMEWLFGDVVYQMTFTDAIANKYITDYKIWLPSIHENNEEVDKELSIYEIDNEIKNRCKFLYSCIANNGSRKCIVYCKDTEDMKSMIECMKTLNEFYIMDIEINSISCEDREKKRKRTLESFANNNDKIQLLFNIRILNECIDIPSCDSIYISYAPKNKITTIQRISRATRTDKNNPYKVANIYIWCEEYEEILETLSSIKEYDIMFKDKIKVNAVEFYHSKEDKDIELVENDKVLISNYTLGIKEFKVMSWEEKLDMVEEYIQENRKLPLSTDKNVMVKQLRNWISHQNKNYKKQEFNMKNKQICIKWEKFIEEYSEFFLSKEEIWQNRFNIIIQYIEDNSILPPRSSTNIEVKKMAEWIQHQKQYYKNKSSIFENQDIRLIWEQFVSKYDKYKTIEDKWIENLQCVKDYVKLNKKLPPRDDNDDAVRKLSNWVNSQKQNYKNKTQILNNEYFYKLWDEFIHDYDNLCMDNDNKPFKTYQEKWFDNFDKVKNYIFQNNKLPSKHDKDDKIMKLGIWISRQNQNYRKQDDLMKYDNIRKIWDEFIGMNYVLFKSNEEVWYDKLNELKTYIENHNKLPSNSYKEDNIKSLARWVQTQKGNYIKKQKIMEFENIRKEWENILSQYRHLFMTREEFWRYKLKTLSEYIDKNEKLPSIRDIDDNVKLLAHFMYTQRQTYKSNTKIMKDPLIRKQWEDFTNIYSVYI